MMPVLDSPVSKLQLWPAAFQPTDNAYLHPSASECLSSHTIFDPANNAYSLLARV